MIPERAIAESAARAGAEELRSRRVDFGAVRPKSSGFDVVTEADVAAGVAVVREIVRHRPQARFVVEEDEVYDRADVARGSLHEDEVWVVDPLDGTTSFVHGYPCYSVSVALLRSGEPVAGAVHAVPSDEMFSAAGSSGAWLNGRRIRCSRIDEIQRSLLVTGFPYDREDTFTRQMRIFERVVRISHDVRRDGSAAIDCCHVASGRCDAFWELGLRPWDMAAGVLIAIEAGATVTAIDGRAWTVDTGDILVANPSLHGKLLGLIEPLGLR